MSDTLDYTPPTPARFVTIPASAPTGVSTNMATVARLRALLVPGARVQCQVDGPLAGRRGVVVEPSTHPHLRWEGHALVLLDGRPVPLGFWWQELAVVR